MEQLTQTQLLEPLSTSYSLRPRISDVLFSTRQLGFDTLAVLSSNVRAVETAIRFSSGINPLVAIIGPSGWGKSHIIESAARRFSTLNNGTRCHVVSANEWLADSRIRNTSGPLIIDNAQDLLGRNRVRAQLQVALERRVKSGKPTLLSFTDTKVSRSIRSTLPHYRDWVVAVIKSPNEPERSNVLSKIAEAEGMVLCDDLKRILASKLDGNGRTLLGALKRLRLTQNRYFDSSATLKACGILTPFFASVSEWDLREHIADAAQSLSEDDRKVAAPFDLALYTMLRVALLAESEVAKFFRIEPAKAYSYAVRFEERKGNSPQIDSLMNRFVDRIVQTL